MARSARACRLAGRATREVAELIAHIASPEANYITGVSHVIDGGMLLMAAQANQLATA
jgi:NAD(P)-dependent dehydrogenase (short-subunit alcohol dehydrogenase family)